MGTFVLGILVGWLAEWLFFTFWVKGRNADSSADCSSLEAELSAKNKEIATLKAAKAESSTTGTTTTAAKPSSKPVTTTKKPSTAKAVTAKKTTPATKTSTASKKATTKKASASKASASKASAKKAPAKKVLAKKVATKKSPVNKNTTPAAAKKTPSKKAKGDDFTKLSGIGPSMALTLNELGITSYTKLAEMDDDILRDMLEASGARLNNNKEAMDSWNEQATLAAKGDFVGLKQLQDELKK